jgi:prolyl 4-hydroxylase
MSGTALRSTLMRRASEGKQVTHRLSRNPDISPAGQFGLDLFTMRNFLSASECAELVAFIDANCAPSGVYTTSTDDDIRSSDTRFFKKDESLAPRIDARISVLTGLDPRKGETWQGQRYGEGQHFKVHHDAFDTDTWYWHEARPKGGQSTWTVMIYLNEPEAGGETHFPEAAVSITPETGMLVLWNNLDARGEINQAALHEGCQIIAGRKYIMTKWFREFFWIENRGLRQHKGTIIDPQASVAVPEAAALA